MFNSMLGKVISPITLIISLTCLYFMPKTTDFDHIGLMVFFALWAVGSLLFVASTLKKALIKAVLFIA